MSSSLMSDALLGIKGREFAYYVADPELRRRRRRDEFSSTSLFYLAADTIWDNKALYCNLFESTGVNQLGCIPKTLRTALIEMRNIDTTRKFHNNRNANNTADCCNFLRLLLNDEVLAVNLKGFPVICEPQMKCITDTFKCLAKECPHLEKLVYEESRRDGGFPFKLGDMVQILRCTLVFNQLQVIDIFKLKCTDLTLGLIADHLPRLRVLNVRLMGHHVTEEGIAALAQLEHLQQFLYVEDRHDFQVIDTKVFGLCMKLLPGLWFSGKMITISLKHIAWYCGTVDADPFYRLEQPWPSALALRQLIVRYPSDMPMVSLPNLETLFVIRPGPSFSLLGLPSLTELGVDGVVHRQELEQLLGSVGHQLTSLSVYVWDTLFVDRVLQMCPCLQKLFILELPHRFIGLDGPLTDDHQCLTELGFTARLREMRLSTRFQPKHLLQILRAVPNLRVWRTNDYWYDEQESALICEALAQKSILQNLAELHVTNKEFAFVGVRPRDFDRVPLSFQEAANKVLRCLIDHCPRLSTVKLNSPR